MTKFHWTKEKVKEAAKKFTTINQFKHNRKNAYAIAKKNNWLDEVCQHMVGNNIKWDKEKILSLAKGFSTRASFRKDYPSAYTTARNNSWLDEACNHMIPLNKKWTNEMLQDEALKYSTRRSFEKGSASAATIARNRGIFDAICSHMERVGNYLKRMVYVYEFPNNVAYIGLTFNKMERQKDHMNKPKSPIYKHIKKTGHQPRFKSISNGYIDATEARKLESRSIEQYKKNGWVVLNSIKGGGLGGTLLKDDIKWTIESSKMVAANYTRKVDFLRNHPSCYMFAYKRGWLDQICSHMPPRSLTIEECKIEANRYTTITQFIKGSPKAYTRAYQRNWLHEVCSHMKRYIQWDEKLVEAEARKYKTRGEFAKENGSAYGFARKNKLLDKVCAHMNNLRNNWSLEKVLKEVEAMNSMKEFRKRAPKAYEAALHNGWINDVWKIILRNNPTHRRRTR